MPSQFSDSDKNRIVQTLESMEEAIGQLMDWNKDISSSEDYYSSQSGMQLLAANCTLITAIGEGVNRIKRIAPTFLEINFPNIPWSDIIGMRNHICHGYFELDADLVYETVRRDIPSLIEIIKEAKNLLTTGG